MEQRDKLTRPEENATIRVKLDQLEIKNMLSSFDLTEKTAKKQTKTGDIEAVDEMDELAMSKKQISQTGATGTVSP